MLALLGILEIRANSPHEMPLTLYLVGSFHRKPSFLSLGFNKGFFWVCYNCTKPSRLCSGWRLDRNRIFYNSRDQELKGSKIQRSRFPENLNFRVKNA
jgi:hypothetical protein